MQFTADTMKAMLNPVRMRIIQHLILHPTATSGEIAAALCDVPKATLYRHIKKLAQLEPGPQPAVARQRGGAGADAPGAVCHPPGHHGRL